MASAVVEVHVHVERVTNLEMLRRGYYRLSISVSCGGIQGVPVSTTAAPARLTSHSRLVGIEGSDLTEPGFVDDASGCYSTRALLLRFSDEEFDVNEGALFRLQVPLPRRALRLQSRQEHAFPPPLRVEVRLLRSDVAAEALLQGAPSPQSYAAASTRVINLRCPLIERSPQPLPSPRQLEAAPLSSSWVPITFDPAYLVTAGLILHACHVGTVSSGGRATDGSTARRTSSAAGAPRLDTDQARDGYSVDGGAHRRAGGSQPEHTLVGTVGGGSTSRTGRVRAAAERWLMRAARTALPAGTATAADGSQSRSGRRSLLNPSVRLRGRSGDGTAVVVDGNRPNSTVSEAAVEPSMAGWGSRIDTAASRLAPARRPSATSTDESVEGDEFTGGSAASSQVGIAALPSGSDASSLRQHQPDPRSVGLHHHDDGVDHKKEDVVSSAPRDEADLDTTRGMVAEPRGIVAAASGHRRLPLAEAMFPRWSTYRRALRRRAADDAALSAAQLDDGLGNARVATVAHGDTTASAATTTAPPFQPLSVAELQSAHAALVGPLVLAYVCLQREVMRLLADVEALAATVPPLEGLFAVPAPGMSAGGIDGAGPYSPHRFHYGVRLAAAAMLRPPPPPQGASAASTSTAPEPLLRTVAAKPTPVAGAEAPQSAAEWAASVDGGPASPSELRDCFAASGVGSARASSSSEVAAAQLSAVGGHLAGLDLDDLDITEDGFGAVVAASTSDAFASRAHSVASNPEAAAHAILQEASLVSRPLAALWNQFMRLLPRFRVAATSTVQARYRAAAIAHLHATVVTTSVLPATSLLDPSGHLGTYAQLRPTTLTVAGGVNVNALLSLSALDPLVLDCAGRVALVVRRFVAMSSEVPVAASAASRSSGADGGTAERDARAAGRGADDQLALLPSTFNLRGLRSSKYEGSESSLPSLLPDADSASLSEGGPSPLPSVSLREMLSPVQRVTLGSVAWDHRGTSGANDGAGAPHAQATKGAPASALLLPRLPSPAHVPPARGPDTPSGSTHVLLLLNGFGGNAADTRLLRAYFKLHLPQLVLVPLVSNQGRATEDDIVTAATRVANEAATALSVTLPSEGLHPRSVSFLGFSLGGLVLRCALRHLAMAPFRSRFRAFISIASPHLGLLHAPASIVSAGLYVLQRLRGSPALAQLSMADGPRGDTRGALLYLLATGWDNDARDRADDGKTPASGSRRRATNGVALMQRLPNFPSRIAAIPRFRARRRLPLRSATPTDGVTVTATAASNVDDTFSEVDADEGDSVIADSASFEFSDAEAEDDAGDVEDDCDGTGDAHLATSGAVVDTVVLRTDAVDAAVDVTATSITSWVPDDSVSQVGAIDGAREDVTDYIQQSISSAPAADTVRATATAHSATTVDGLLGAGVVGDPVQVDDAVASAVKHSISQENGDQAAAATGDALVKLTALRDGRGAIKRVTRLPPAVTSLPTTSVSTTQVELPRALSDLRQGASHAPETSATPSTSLSAQTVASDKLQTPYSAPSAAAAAVANPTVASLVAEGFDGASNGKLMAAFSRVILIGSGQDTYAPRPSCLAQWGESSLADARRGPPIGEMIRYFFDGLSPAAVTRMDVLFRTLSGGGGPLQGSVSAAAAGPSRLLPTIDSVIGRDAHVAHLESEAFVAALALWLAGEAVWE